MLVCTCWLVLGWPGSRRFPGVCGVSRGCFLVRFRSCPFLRRSVRSLRVCALGWFRARRFVPSVLPVVLRFRGGGAVFFFPRRCAVRGVLGWSVRPFWRFRFLLCRSLGARRCWRCALLGGLRSGGPAARSRSPGWRVPRLGRCVRRSVRRWRLVVPGLLAVFAAGLPAACRSRPAPGLAGVLFVACPSRVAAGAASRRARWFGLRVLACGPRGAGWLVAVALPLAPRPCPVSRRLGAFAPGGAPALPGVPLPVPPRGGAVRSAPAPRAPRPVSLPLF